MKNFRLALRYSKYVINPAYRKTLDDFYDAAKGADIIIYHPKALGAVDIAVDLGIACVSMPPIPITFPVGEFANLAVTHKNLGPVLNKLTYKVNEKAESSQINEINDFREKTLGLRKRKAGIYSYTDGRNKIPVIYPNLPNLLYIGHLTYLWNPYKINVFGLFSFTFICIIDIIIFSDYTYVWGNRRGISGIFEKQKWYYIRV